MSAGLRLPGAARIRDDHSANALRSRPRVRGRWFVVASLGTGQQRSRLLVRVAKKVMKSAVARNRMRRCVKEVFRQQRIALSPADFLVSVIHPYREPTLQAARQELEQLLRASAR